MLAVASRRVHEAASCLSERVSYQDQKSPLDNNIIVERVSYHDQNSPLDNNIIVERVSYHDQNSPLDNNIIVEYVSFLCTLDDAKYFEENKW
ncbi:hypothetical protein RRG08_030901 [Elysia crispata]|uniref:Uncharacterized protein n=1 Tax=Elysia crispata TaxID=231223 RepID=A0AAE1DXQ2_9GAST|nr:hypothetical protein RRG08_030901 [Elysia crispata]